MGLGLEKGIVGKVNSRTGYLADFCMDFKNFRGCMMRYLILITVAFSIGFFLGKLSLNIQSDKGNSNTTQSEILLEFKPVETKGITKDEQEQIEKFVDTFEGYKYQKDTDKLLAMFTLPETPEDQNDLDSILGKDYASDGEKPISRLFSTQGYNHSVGGHYVRSIKKDGNSIIVAVDELRIFYTGLSEDLVGYSATVVNMMIELEKNDGGYQIAKYYHAHPDDKLGSKYEGFVAY